MPGIGQIEVSVDALVSVAKIDIGLSLLGKTVDFRSAGIGKS